MNLDDLSRFKELDPENMLAEIEGLPDQLQAAWDQGQRQPLADITGVKNIVIAGMGGSAIGGDLLVAYVSQFSAIPLMVWRDYDLPAFVAGPETLVITSSHSGNTEEVLSALDRGLDSGAQLLAVTTGGELKSRAAEHGIPAWIFEHAGQPRAAVGYSFGLLLSAITRLGLIPDPTAEVIDAVAAMRRQQERLRPEIPTCENPAKLIAGQLLGRCPTIVGAGLLAPVARRWRTQIAELAKAVAQFEALPEANHNMLAGVSNPESLFASIMVVFLRASLAHPRNLLRLEKTNEIFMVEGFGTSVIEARGDTRLAQQWTILHFGDYCAFYLAMAYGIDPTPVIAIEDLKQRLREAESANTDYQSVVSD
jgi:glucose/mannose-6-phosphate isomerase